MPTLRHDGIAVTSILSSGVQRFSWSSRGNLSLRRSKMRVAVYVRVSTQRQAQAQTIEQQLDRLREYTPSQGWPWGEEPIFHDDGYSRASLRPPALYRLREQPSQTSIHRSLLP